jgi:predicted DsbA family dithiol-disulfide isomerase
METDTRLQLEVWSDIACPWCYVGRRNLSIALADIEEHERPAVIWRAFQLEPTISGEGVEADTYFASRFGPDLTAFEESRERLVAMGEEVGIAFRFDRQRVVPNTYLAHRVLAAADLHEERESLMDALFAAYFEQGIDIGSPENLREVAGTQLGDMNLGARLVELAVTDPTRARRVDEDLAMARELGITGVPCFVADRRIAVPGAVPPPVLAQLLAEASAAAEDADEDE